MIPERFFEASKGCRGLRLATGTGSPRPKLDKRPLPAFPTPAMATEVDENGSRAKAAPYYAPHEDIEEGEVQTERFEYEESRKLGVMGSAFIILNKMIGTGSGCSCAPPGPPPSLTSQFSPRPRVSLPRRGLSASASSSG